MIKVLLEVRVTQEARVRLVSIGPGRGPVRPSFVSLERLREAGVMTCIDEAPQHVSLRRSTHRAAGTATGPEGNSDLTLVALGDQVAFSRLYRTFGSRVFCMARSVLRDPATAEDVAQDVFLEVWRKASRFDPTKGSAASWILTLARSRAIDRIRSTEVSRIRDSNWAHRQGVRETDTVVESVLEGYSAQQVKTALAGLTDLQRQAVELSYLRGLTSSEISRVLEVSTNTVKTRIRSGLLRLRAEVPDSDLGGGEFADGWGAAATVSAQRSPLMSDRGAVRA